MPTPERSSEEDAEHDPATGLPGTPPPQVTSKQRSRLTIGLVITFAALVVVVTAYLLITAIPNGGGSP